MGKMKTTASVDEYISTVEPKAKKALRDIRKTIKSAVPKAEEVISYQLPGYKYHGMLCSLLPGKTTSAFIPHPGELNR